MDSLGHNLSKQPGSVLEQGSSILTLALREQHDLGNRQLAGPIRRHLARLGTEAARLSDAAGHGDGRIEIHREVDECAKPHQHACRREGQHRQGTSFRLFAERRARLGGRGFGDSSFGRAGERPAARWLLPTVAVAGLALLAWWLIPSSSTPAPEAVAPAVIRRSLPMSTCAPVAEAAKTVIPDVTKFSTELTDTFSKLTEALSGVKDAASAEAALPKLQDLEGKLASAKTTAKELGDAGRTAIKTLVIAAEAKLKVLVDKALAIPGVGEKMKTVVNSIMVKLGDLAS